MKVVIIGRHLEVTPALQSWVEQKARYHKTSFRRERGGCELVMDRFWMEGVRVSDINWKGGER
jgi:ribosome-associated translation inhibitor RaiA